MTILTSLHQSSLSTIVPEIDINPRFDQERNNLMVALSCRVMEGGIPNTKSGISSKSRVIFKQSFGFLNIAISCSGNKAFSRCRAPKGIPHKVKEPHRLFLTEITTAPEGIDEKRNSMCSTLFGRTANVI